MSVLQLSGVRIFMVLYVYLTVPCKYSLVHCYWDWVHNTVFSSFLVRSKKQGSHASVLKSITSFWEEKVSIKLLINNLVTSDVADLLPLLCSLLLAPCCPESRAHPAAWPWHRAGSTCRVILGQSLETPWLSAGWAPLLPGWAARDSFSFFNYSFLVIIYYSVELT